MDFGLAIKTCFSKCANFSGRASRPEYWWFFLFTMIVYFITSFVDGITGLPILNWIAMLALLLPSLAVGARRLHDMGYSAWWLLLALVPVIGGIALIIWFCMPGTPGTNRFGDAPAPSPALPRTQSAA
jgi:uncharacterized membrane protein YhaH (DUF805 family)